MIVRPFLSAHRLRAVALAGVSGLAGAMLVGSSAATPPPPPPPNTTHVNFTPLTPVKSVWGGNAISAGKAEATLVAGGAANVPSDATTVQLLITVKGSKAGVLTFYPNGNPAGASDQTLSWPAGGSNTGTIAVNVGQNDKVAVLNGSAASATVGLKITGYSTQVTNQGINSYGGAAGQVLTSDGAGGSSWMTAGRAYATQSPFGGVPLSASGVEVAAVAVPPGSYLVNFNATMYGSPPAPDYFVCDLYGPAGGYITSQYGIVRPGGDQLPFSMTALVTAATNGAIKVRCYNFYGPSSSAFAPAIVATQVGAATGAINARPVRRESTGPRLTP